ncbi:diaminopimelate decarboxylase, partial [Candidatus Hakubella thermalkaliphila]
MDLRLQLWESVVVLSWAKVEAGPRVFSQISSMEDGGALDMPYPLTTAINRRGHLEVGGCDLVDLAYKYGTPLFVVDEETIRAKCQQYVQAFRHLEEDAEIIYAAKAFGALAVCQIIREEGLFVDVSTGGELYVALRSGFSPHKIYFHGNNKTEEEIEFGLREEVGTFVVDGLQELHLLDRLSGRGGRRTDILLRIT